MKGFSETCGAVRIEIRILAADGHDALRRDSERETRPVAARAIFVLGTSEYHEHGRLPVGLVLFTARHGDANDTRPSIVLDSS
jgi:hypothetical protein